MNFIFWVAIVIGAILVLIILKFKEVRHKLGFLIILTLVLSFGLSVWYIYSANHFDLTTFDGLVATGKVYFVWIGHITGNVVDIGRYVYDRDWGLNKTNSSVTQMLDSK